MPCRESRVKTKTMKTIEIRTCFGVFSPDDLVANIQDATYEYLMTSDAPKIRVSAYLERDWPLVKKTYAEIFIHADCAFESRIEEVIPGSKRRENIALPGPMKEGEQLTILVKRSSTT